MSKQKIYQNIRNKLLKGKESLRGTTVKLPQLEHPLKWPILKDFEFSHKEEKLFYEKIINSLYKQFSKRYQDVPI